MENRGMGNREIKQDIGMKNCRGMEGREMEGRDIREDRKLKDK